MAAPRIGNPNDPFIVLLKEIVADPEVKRTKEEIDHWRARVNHRAFVRDIVELGPDHHQMPEEIAFAVEHTEHPVDAVKFRKILNGRHVPTLGELERITQNFGLPPESDRAQQVITLGTAYYEKYGLDAIKVAQPGALGTFVAAVSAEAPESGPKASQTLGDAMKQLRLSRGIASRDGLAQLVGVSVQTIGRVEGGDRIGTAAWNGPVACILHSLKATPDERCAITALYDEQYKSKHRDQTTPASGVLV